MPEKPNRPTPFQVLHNLQRASDAKRQEISAPGLDPRLQALREWQSRRLSRTYADVSADPRFAGASTFFLSDIYGPQDFSQRDHDFTRLHEMLARLLPAEMLALLSDALELNRFSLRLDAALLEALVEEEPALLHKLTIERYVEAYRRCDNYPQRVDQIERLAQILLEAGALALAPLTGPALRLAGLPARRFGWEELYGFLERGYTAFRPMRGQKDCPLQWIEVFVHTIRTRERLILDRIYAFHPDPFDEGRLSNPGTA